MALDVCDDLLRPDHFVPAGLHTVLHAQATRS